VLLFAAIAKYTFDSNGTDLVLRLIPPVGMAQRYYAAKLIGKLTSSRSLRLVDRRTRVLSCVPAQVQHVQCPKRSACDLE
jgi:hypothetical protein